MAAPRRRSRPFILGIPEALSSNDQLISVTDLAPRFAVSRGTLLAWIRAGKVPAIKIGKAWRIRLGDARRVLHGGDAR